MRSLINKRLWIHTTGPTVRKKGREGRLPVPLVDCRIANRQATLSVRELVHLVQYSRLDQWHYDWAEADFLGGQCCLTYSGSYRDDARIAESSRG